MAERAVTPDELGLPDSIPLPGRADWRIGLIGFGGIANAHVPAYTSAGWQIVAVADPDPAARERARAMTDAEHICEDYLEVIGDDRVEVVSLLTHPTLREPVVAAAAQAGKPLLTEKPLGIGFAECERTVAIARQAGLPFAVSQNYRWSGANFLAHHVIRKGLIGRPFYASIEIQGTQDVELAGHPFYSTCEEFLTVQWNNHLADLLRYWTGRDARRVLACTRRMAGQNFHSDNLMVSIADFGEGLTGHVVHSELLRSSLKADRCRVDGDEGSVTFDLHGDALRLQSKELGGEPCVVDASGVLSTSSFCGPMGDLLLSVEEGREPLTSARRNLETMRHVFAEVESARAGGVWVEL
ncbi:MAG: Gfo/Idh/MocA family oxidoreductase [Candidatus Brocadiae bacterium]|nr:Gfo/Idh/MocA family oxidoreductase [Candidatus Brocadiia bacterium]